MRASGAIRVCHVASGDSWAGTEAQIAALLPSLAEYPDLKISAVVFNRHRLDGELRSHGIPVTVFDECRLTSMGLFFRLFAHFRRSSVDIVHTHGYKQQVLAGLAARTVGVPRIVTTIHGAEEPFSGAARIRMHGYMQLARLANRWVTDAVVAVSDKIRDEVARHTGGRAVTIPNGVSGDAGSARSRRETVREGLGVRGDEYLVGTVGRLVPVKGLDDFLDAAGLITGAMEKVRFVLVGEGPCRQSLEMKADRQGLSHAVIFTGFRADAIDLIAAMDTLVLSSIDEGLPTVLLEAMLLGTPVVASAVGGIAEVVKDGESGLLAPPRDPVALADRIAFLSTHPREAQRMARNAEAAVAAGYSTRQQAKSVRSLYRLLLAEAEARAEEALA